MREYFNKQTIYKSGEKSRANRRYKECEDDGRPVDNPRIYRVPAGHTIPPTQEKHRGFKLI